MTTSSSPLLEVQHLSVGFTSEGSTLTAVRDVTLEVRPHEFFSLVGESGSGKSVTVMTAMGLLDANGYVEQGCIRYDGQMLLDNIMPKMLVAGFVCLTITSVVITGVFVNYLVV